MRPCMILTRVLPSPDPPRGGAGLVVLIESKVAVFRLISKGTIEEMCYMRQIYKLQITSAAMGDEARGGRRQFNAVQVR